jgi:regulator of cell morphogenesis and NO signaling
MTNTTTLAEIAVTHPAAARVFYQNRLDFCCGGRRSLADACEERGLDAQAILDTIAREDAATVTTVRWDAAPLPALVDHIVNHYHRGLRESLPNLVHMARKVEGRHGDKSSCPLGLADHLARVQVAVLDHLEKEEQILFPTIVRGMGARAAGPVHVLEAEHSNHKIDLLRIRELTADLTPPAEACTTWRALYLALQQFERDLMEHIHLENNILFRRALVQ